MIAGSALFVAALLAAGLASLPFRPDGRRLARLVLILMYASIATYPVTRFLLPFGLADLLVPLIAVFAIRSWLFGRRPSLPRIWVVAGGVYLFSVGASLVVNAAGSTGFSLDLAASQIFRVLQNVTAAVCAYFLLPPTSALRTHSRLVMGVGLLVVADAWLQQLEPAAAAVASQPWGQFADKLPAWVGGDQFRVYATTGNPINLAGLMQFPFAYALCIAMSPEGTRRNRAIALAAAGAFSSAIWLTQSRSGLIGMGLVTAALILGALFRGDRVVRRLALACVPVVIVGAVVLSAHLEDRPSTTVQRTLMWRSGVDAFLEHPLFGVGPRQYSILYPARYIRPGASTDPSVYTTDNIFLQQAVDYGLTGLLAYLLVFGAAVGSALAIRRRTAPRSEQMLASATVIGLFGWLAVSQFAVLSAAESILLVWTTFGALARAHSSSVTSFTEAPARLRDRSSV